MPSARKPAPNRCAYREGRAQCRRNGAGNPPLCDAHRIVLEGAAGRESSAFGDGLRGIFDVFTSGKKATKAQIRNAFEDVSSVLAGERQVTEIFGDMGDYIPTARAAPPRQAAPNMGWASTEDLMREMRARVQEARAQAARSGWAPPGGGPRQAAPPPRKPTGPDPREVLGFTNREALTKDLVQKRRRELARKHHPDKGGSVDRMAQINHAADQLLAELR